PVSSNIYICALGSLHICSRSCFEYYGAQQDQTCHVSGIQHGTVVSSYDANDWRTWKKVVPGAEVAPVAKSTTATTTTAQKKATPSRKRKSLSVSGNATAVAEADRAETIVTNLLFSSMRTQRNLAA